MIEIKNLQLENSKILLADMVTSGEFTGADGTLYENLPDFCRVVIESSLGSGSHIMTEVWMPKDWNGILLGLGCGGMAGYINCSGLSERIRSGYAAVTCDMGTARGEKSGINNPDVWKDFGWRGTHNMTVMAKEIVKCHYGKEQDYAYFIGGSTGGQQAFSLAQRSPEDYDGILAGVPANNRIFLHTYFLWNNVHLRTKKGEPLFTTDEIQQLTACGVKFFQENGDGEKGDNFITNPYQDEDTVENFLAFVKKSITFTDVQIDALRAVYNGPVNPKTGKQIYNGMPIGSEIYSCGINDCQQEETPHFYPFRWAFGEDYRGNDFDFADDMDTINSLMSPHMNANNPDLGAFYANGGKLISYSGSADPCVPYPDAMNYYNRVCEKMGGYEKVSEFFKYYLVPGRDHGAGGNGANQVLGEEYMPLLDVIRKWREENIAPKHLLAVRLEEEKEIFARKIYPYEADGKTGKTFPKACDEEYLR